MSAIAGDFDVLGSRIFTVLAAIFFVSGWDALARRMGTFLFIGHNCLRILRGYGEHPLCQCVENPNWD